MNSEKRWSILLLSLCAVTLVCIGGVTATVDPFFHYHAPLDGLEYVIDSQRYQNDGITRHFDYDALITGTSVTENFKTSEFDALFGTHSIKVPYSGGTLEEITGNIETALTTHPEIRYVFFGIDAWFLHGDWQMLQTDGDFPAYLYDEALYNDAAYLLNKQVLFEDTLGTLSYTRYGQKTTSFDVYSNWNDLCVFTTEHTIGGYDRPDPEPMEPALSPQEQFAALQPVWDTLLKFAEDYPNVRFLYFYPPYSILTWDMYLRRGTFDQLMDAYTLASARLLEEENIALYSFFTDRELVTTLSNYSDILHYSQDISSLLLQRIARGEFRLTKENYLDHWAQVRTMAKTFDYETLLSG